ncbi:isocitrate lyase/phosphoenolpyruvate mutase family protein [Kitasatospora sp. NPDC049285]|uniref:isocitrate lyase/PEP mutase family protein n=1 Tax=Kitasatospora sp. NPDC049285 TaxID=3157096 RepID=UPI003418A102
MSLPTTPRTDHARLLRKLSANAVLVLPNAWDAGSAAVIAAAGAAAIATTSGGVSWSAGRGDGQRLTRAESVEAVRRIAAAVDVPVTADIEGGYGPAPEDVAATVRAVVEAGAVGVNLEDSTAPGGPLFDPAAQAERLRAARAAAAAAGLPELVLNARTDVFLFGIGDAADRPAEVLRRAEAYAAAGADSLFVPGLLDLPQLADLTARSPLPVNAMAVPGGPTVAELAAAGVRRISLGTALAQAAYTAAHRAAAELLGPGSLHTLDGALDFGTLNALFRD